jgi:hypothetical protein
MTAASSPPAQEKAQEVAGEAREQAQDMAGKAQDKLREQLNQRSSEAGEKVAGTAEDLRSVGEELRNKGKDTPAKFADQAAERTERLGSYLRESDADTILSDMEDFGRRQPMAVLAGGVVLGMVAARFLKSSSQSRYQGRLGSEGSTRELPEPASTSVPPAYERAPADPTRAPADPTLRR